VLVLVDAAAFPEQLADRYLTDTLERQLARADLVVLNKTDLATPGLAADAVRRIRGDVGLVEVAHAALPDALLGGVLLGDSPPCAASRFHAGPPEHGFRTWLWDDPAPFDRGALAAVLDGLPQSVLRLKGMCSTDRDAAPHLLQLAGRRWSLTPVPAGPTPGLVMIGTSVLPAADALAALFRTALLTKMAVPFPA